MYFHFPIVCIVWLKPLKAFPITVLSITPVLLGIPGFVIRIFYKLLFTPPGVHATVFMQTFLRMTKTDITNFVFLRLNKGFILNLPIGDSPKASPTTGTFEKCDMCPVVEDVTPHISAAGLIESYLSKESAL